MRAVEEGALYMGAWVLDKILILLRLLRPVILTFFLVVLGVLAFFIVFKAGTMAAFQRLFGVATPVNKELSQTHEAIE